MFLEKGIKKQFEDCGVTAGESALILLSPASVFPFPLCWYELQAESIEGKDIE